LEKTPVCDDDDENENATPSLFQRIWNYLIGIKFAEYKNEKTKIERQDILWGKVVNDLRNDRNINTYTIKDDAFFPNGGNLTMGMNKENETDKITMEMNKENETDKITEVMEWIGELSYFDKEYRYYFGDEGRKKDFYEDSDEVLLSGNVILPPWERDKKKRKKGEKKGDDGSNDYSGLSTISMIIE
jgi:hypothetical protein